MRDAAKTPAEIEDVLSSIRRLVSEHQPGPDGSMQPRPGAARSEEPAAALVLTESLRVSEPDDPWVPVATAEESDETDTLISGLVEELTNESRTMLSGAASDDESWRRNDRLADFDDVGEDVGAQDGTAPSLDTVEPAEAEAEPTDTIMPEEDDADAIADLARLDGLDLDQAAFEPETGDDGWPEPSAEAALLNLVARREPLQLAPSEPEPETEASDAAGAPIAGDATPDVTEDFTPMFSRRHTVTTPAAVETADAEEDAVINAFGPDTGGTDDRESEDDLSEDGATFSFADGEDNILDEETLREIIVEVVRDELQGALGQRITRNVRKLVRREIRLALAVEDLE